MTTTTRATLAVATLAALTAIAACADFSSPVDPTGGLPDVPIAHPSLSADIQPLFTKRCALGGCHTPASARAGLVLSAGVARDSLVNIPSKHGGVGLPRVKPGDYFNSYLWRVLQPDSTLRPGFVRMPLAATPLTTNQIQNIANWIDDGALDN